MAATRAPSSTPIPSTETNPADGASSNVSEEEWKAMTTVLNNVYAYRMEEYVVWPSLWSGCATRWVINADRTLQWLRPFETIPAQGQQTRCAGLLQRH
jgi:hypothetical protein